LGVLTGAGAATTGVATVSVLGATTFSALGALGVFAFACSTEATTTGAETVSEDSEVFGLLVFVGAILLYYTKGNSF
jgi:hypothetical protein